MFLYEVEQILAPFSPEVCKGEEGNIPYRLYVPEGNPENLPVLLFMHGAGERGDDNHIQLINALGAFAKNNPEAKDSIIIAPQCPAETQWVNTPWYEVDYKVDEIPETWQLKTVIKLLEEVIVKYNADRDRVYVMGISMGGFGTWDLLMRHGDVFAAGMPICGGADPSKAEILKDIPIRTFHGDVDDAVLVQGTRNIYNAIIAAGGKKIEYLEYAGEGHWVWDMACSEPGIGAWMYSNRLSDRK